MMQHIGDRANLLHCICNLIANSIDHIVTSEEVFPQPSPHIQNQFQLYETEQITCSEFT